MNDLTTPQDNYPYTVVASVFTEPPGLVVKLSGSPEGLVVTCNF